MGGTEETLRVGERNIAIIRGGRGKPLLILNDELGYTGWLGWHEALSKERALVIPLQPGFGKSPRAEWISSIRDLSIFNSWIISELALTHIDVLAFSFGGWLAAEMAVNNPDQFNRMVLVGAMGIKPQHGLIAEMFTRTPKDYLEFSVKDAANTPEYAQLYGPEAPERIDAWEEARTESARLGWQPYMNNPSLPHLLKGVKNVPVLLVWGREDAIVPPSCGEAYRDAIEGSKLVQIAGSGHRPEIERSGEFVKLVREFLH